MKSIAVWFNYKDSTNQAGQDDPSAALHFNYWRLEKQDFLDIGILIDRKASIKAINIYIPVKQLTIENLGHLFRELGVARGIFNEQLELIIKDNNVLFLKSASWGDSLLGVYESSKKNTSISEDGFELRSTVDGTSIVITENAIEKIKDCKLYFRFRTVLAHGEANPFIAMYAPKDHFVLSGYDTIECIDFRLNEVRNLPDSIGKELLDEDKKPINKIHFLLACSIRSEFVSGHTKFEKSRLLESENWDPYIKNNDKERKIPEGMIIYHWKKEERNIREFSAFVKLKVRRTGGKIISIYFIIILLISYVSGICANYSWKHLDQSSSPPVNQIESNGKMQSTKEKDQ